MKTNGPDKNILLSLALLFATLALFIYISIAYPAPIVINPPPDHKALPPGQKPLWGGALGGGSPEYSISVGGQSRILRVFFEGDNLILRYFKDDNARLEFLGEEIFDRDGIKVHDSYLENNGMWPAGYEKRYRK